tara:strand:+ start:9566 stop:10324 length:759 start_codon:yes stop_codon:yes gene_type:complete
MIDKKNHLDRTVEILCSKCLFFDESEKTEDACVANRLKAMKEAKNPVNFCFLHRPKDIDTEGKSREEFAEQCIENSGETFGIIVFDDSENPEDVKKTISSIKKINYPKKQFIVVLSVKEKTLLDRDSSVLEYVNDFNQLHFDSIQTRAVFHKDYLKVHDRETEVFQKISSVSRFINLDAGSEVDPDFMKCINEKSMAMEKIIYAEDSENNVVCIPKSVASSFYLNYLDYRLMLEGIIKESVETDTYLKYEKK